MIHESGTDPYYPFRKASWTWSILRVLTPQRLCSAGGCSFVALFPWHYLCDMRTHLLISWSLQSVPHIWTFFGGHFSLEEVVSQKILRGFFRGWLLYCYCCGGSVEEQAFYIAVHNYISMVKLTHCCFEGALAFWSSSFGRLLLLLSQNIELGGFTRWCGAKLGFSVVLLHNSDIKIPTAICSKRKLLSSLLKQEEIYPCLWRCYLCNLFFFKSWAKMK